MKKLMDLNALHEQSELLLIGNAWDVLSAMVLEQAGFKAIGTTSWGVANAMGYNDGESIEFSELLTLVGKMVSSVNIPVSVDMEAGYSEDKNQVAENVLKVADLGAVGINFEDSLKHTLKQKNGLMDKHKQCELIATIRKKLDNNGYSDFFINARTDTYFQLKNPLAETIDRARDYISHGANGLFVPGLSDHGEIEKLVGSIDAPLNLMSLPNLTDVNSVNKLGVKRFSLGNGLSDATTAFIEKMSRQILAEQNSAGLYDHSEVKTQFK